ncbi:MAG: hypothetical protein JO166_06545 [Deltaproteobacteria bacterium]|nr:hypothetical protein [Deltaproteobacteria bacterium]
MKRLFRAPLLFAVSALIVVSLLASRRSYPLPTELRTRIVSGQTPDEVYIHIRSYRQTATAIHIRARLMQDGYLVPRIILVSSGPNENQVRYFHDDRARAGSVANDLRAIGLRPIAVERIGHYENNPAGRYELWLAPYTR